MAEAVKKKKEVNAYRAPARTCKKCGARMAEHSDRFACGRCGYTEFKEQR